MDDDSWAHGWVGDWNTLNNTEGDVNSDTSIESIERCGETIATFDIVWKSGDWTVGGEDYHFGGETITIKRFDPFKIADVNERDAARRAGQPFEDIYRAYFRYGWGWEFRGTYGCSVSPCRYHFTSFKRLRENRRLRDRTGDWEMQFGTDSSVKDDNGAPFLHWYMPPGNGRGRAQGWAKQRRSMAATQPAVLSQAERQRLNEDQLRVQMAITASYIA